MKIPEAIEILFDLLQTSSREKSPDSWDALKLGKEALERIKAWRDDNNEDLLWDLPGETKD